MSSSIFITFLNRFKAIWDDRDSEYGEVRKYEVLYILATDNVVVKEVHDSNDGRDPYPLLLRKTKLPKVKSLKNLLFTLYRCT